jgi:hypothetical protein
MYDIKWKEQTYSSSISFSMEGENCMADYTFVLKIPELKSYTTMACTA